MKEQSKALAVNNVSPGSQELRNRVYERYARYRAQYLPRHEAWKAANITAFRGRTRTVQPRSAYEWGYRLEQRDEIKQRIQYLTKDEVETIRLKRKRIEEKLWSIHEADIGDYFETTPTGEEKPKRLSDMSPEIRRNIEKITIDAKGRIFPQLHNSLVASKELRAMLNIGKSSEQLGSSMSDAELVAQLADQAKQLGVEIDLNFRFAQHQGEAPHDADTDGVSPQVIDNVKDDKS